jgi:molybdenum-dependent DNA-binding transcriptional regulator ModE
VQAKFAAGWKHKRIEAEIAKVDRAFMQRRLAGRNGGIKSGIARAVAQGEAIIRAQAEGRRALARNASEREAGGQAELKPPRTNHNHRFSSSSSPSSSENEPGSDPPGPEQDARAGMLEKLPRSKPANQWSRQELDALFARRTFGAAAAPAPDDADPAPNDVSSDKQTGG